MIEKWWQVTTRNIAIFVNRRRQHGPTMLAEVRWVIRSPTKERDPERRLGYYHFVDGPRRLIAKQFSPQPDLGHILDITTLLIAKTAFDNSQIIIIGEVCVPGLVSEFQNLSS